jgi:hypothetical protein
MEQQRIKHAPLEGIIEKHIKHIWLNGRWETDVRMVSRLAEMTCIALAGLLAKSSARHAETMGTCLKCNTDLVCRLADVIYN